MLISANLNDDVACMKKETSGHVIRVSFGRVAHTAMLSCLGEFNVRKESTSRTVDQMSSNADERQSCSCFKGEERE